MRGSLIWDHRLIKARHQASAKSLKLVTAMLTLSGLATLPLIKKCSIVVNQFQKGSELRDS